MTHTGAGSWSLVTAIERMPGVTILTARGRIGSKNSKGLELAVEAARQGSALVIVDLDGVDYISGPGMTILRDAWVASPGQIVLCGLRDPVRIALELAGLDGIAVERNRDAAIARVRSDL